MGDGAEAPPVQSAGSTAQQQLDYNLKTAAAGQRASMVDQANPWGSLTYEQTGTGPNGMPIYKANTTLSPEMQGIINSLQGGVQGQLNQGAYGTSSFEDYVGDMTSGKTKQLLDTQTAYLNPFFTQQKQELDTQLRNQGVDPYGPAYAKAMNNLSQSQNQLITGFLAQAQPAAYAQSKETYLAPLQMAAQMMGLNSAKPFTEALVNPPQTNVANVDYTGAVRTQQEAEMAKYKADLAKEQSMMEGMFKMPTAILGGWAASPAGGAALTSGMGAVGSGLSAALPMFI